MTIRLAVFDCDGTLVDGQAEVCDTMEAAFAEAGLPAPIRNAVRRSVGLSLPAAMRQLVPDADEETQRHAVECYRQIYRGRRMEGRISEPLYPGIPQLLHNLHQAGWLLAVATGKSERGLRACLETHGILDLFVSLQTADRHPSKPHPAMLEAAMIEGGALPEEAVMIGDTTFDILMANDAGVRAIGVDWGYHEAHELRVAGAQAVASDPAHLERLL